MREIVKIWWLVLVATTTVVAKQQKGWQDFVNEDNIAIQEAFEGGEIEGRYHLFSSVRKIRKIDNLNFDIFELSKIKILKSKIGIFASLKSSKIYK